MGSLLRSCFSEEGDNTGEHALGTVVLSGMGCFQDHCIYQPSSACVGAGGCVQSYNGRFDGLLLLLKAVSGSGLPASWNGLECPVDDAFCL